ncbi:MAG: hypothetical protein IKU35_07945 [Bacteroidaceae bacterium]|nr:hypothetical protein [Bacteroidaceae bacterium]
MEFITIPLTFGIVTYGIYKLFELIICRKERIMLLEKLDSFACANIPDLSAVFGKYRGANISFTSLRVGSVMFGVGLGLMLGFFITVAFTNELGHWSQTFGYSSRFLQNLIIGGSVLLCGGLGLIVSYIIERNTQNKD